MNSVQVNYLNIGLMILSTAVAFVVPFELFLFAYAVLGPLHYLTEISWLHDKGYYTKNKYDYLFLGILCFFLLIFEHATNVKPDVGTGLIYVAFFGAMVFLLVKSGMVRLISMVLIIASVFFLKDLKTYQIFFAIFLPTIVHVFIFTGAFIFMGALRGKSVSGFVSLAVFVICALSFFIHIPNATDYHVGAYVRDTYARYQVVNIAMLKVFGIGKVTSVDDIYTSQAGLVVMRFIAFAYTYHYLNWFSKTSIIKWNNISRARMIVIGILWVASLSIYGYDYRTGGITLFFLGFLHVFLEFPLDHQTFIGIGKELYAMARR